MSKTRKNNISLFLATAITFTSLTIGEIDTQK